MLGSFREQFKQFLLNPVFLSCMCSWFCAQFIKTILGLFYGRIHNLSELFEMMFWRTGGLPSSHSALVSSLCTTIAFNSGLNSNIFILSLCFFLITIRDALGVRRANGIQARKLNEIGRKLDEEKILNYQPMKEVQGHTPLEVFIGILLGFFIGLAFSLLK
jgi:uncharacterized protein